MKPAFAPTVLALALFTSAAFGQGFQPPWWLGLKGPTMKNVVLRAEDQADLTLEVFFPGLVDETSLDDNDLWVISRQGFNHFPKLESGKPVYERDARAPQAGDAELPPPKPEDRLGVLARYKVSPPGPLWAAKDNDTYTVLVEPIQVGLLKSQDYLSAWRLGAFRVAVGEPEPAKPTVVLSAKEAFAADEPIEFTVTYQDERALDSRSVGEGDVILTARSSDFPGEVPGIWRLAQPEIIKKEVSDSASKISVQYRVVNHALKARGSSPSVLFPGSYTLSLAADAVCDVDGMCLGGVELGGFRALGTPLEPLAPDATVLVKRSPRQYFASAQLALPPGVIVTNWGAPIQDGKTFTADVRMRSVPWLVSFATDAALEPNWSYRTAQVWGDSRFTYTLGLPKPGPYKFVLRYQGKPMVEADFEVKEVDLSQTPPPQGGQIWVEKDSAQFLAFLELAGNNGFRVDDWGAPKLTNSSIYRIDLKVTKRDGGGNPGLDSGAVHVYELGRPAKDGLYQVQVYAGDQLFMQAQFKVDPPGPAPAPPSEEVNLKVEQQGEEVYAHVSFEVSPEDPCEITEWGAVTRRGNVFYLDAKSVANGPLTPENRSCAHRYRLLPATDPGGAVNPADLGPDGLPVLYANYFIVFRLNGAVLTKVPFTRDFDGLRVGLQVQDIWEPIPEPQEFAITWQGGPQLDIKGVQAIDVTVRSESGAFTRKAELKKIDIQESQPPRFVARYAVAGPGGAWDFADNGRYDIFYVRVPNGVDPELAKARPITVGSFFARIGPDLPESAEAAKVELKIEQSVLGQFAKVRILPGVSFEVKDWGESELNGDTFYVTPDTAKPAGQGGLGENQIGGGNPNAVTTKEQTHEYKLGKLKPGLYVFVLKTNGPAARVRFWVNDPNGGPAPSATDALAAPRDNWREAAFGRSDKEVSQADRADSADPDGDGSNNFAEYAFGTDPLDPADKYTPFIHLIERGKKRYAAVTYRQVTSAVDAAYFHEVSPTLHKDWLTLDTQYEVLNREGNLDGTETVTIALKVSVEDAPEEFLRVRVEPK